VKIMAISKDMRLRGVQMLRRWTSAARVMIVDDCGSGTVLVLGIIAVLLAMAVCAGGLIQAQAAAGKARSAVDLAALGGATALSSIVAPGEPCEVAGRVARANGAEVTECTVVGEDVVVEVSVRTRVLGIDREAVSAARAGPADAP